MAPPIWAASANGKHKTMDIKIPNFRIVFALLDGSTATRVMRGGIEKEFSGANLLLREVR
jgi:hypothetical protein